MICLDSLCVHYVIWVAMVNSRYSITYSNWCEFVAEGEEMMMVIDHSSSPSMCVQKLFINVPTQLVGCPRKRIIVHLFALRWWARSFKNTIGFAREDICGQLGWKLNGITFPEARGWEFITFLNSYQRNAFDSFWTTTCLGMSAVSWSPWAVHRNNLWMSIFIFIKWR